MNCGEVQQQLNRLCDGERLSPAGRYLGTARHVLVCGECRAAGRRLRQMRRLAQQLPRAEAPVRLPGSILARLPERAPVAVPPRGRRPVMVGIARAALAAGLIAAGLVVFPWGRNRQVGQAVEAAVQRANTWHLKGWKLQDGRRVPWEIWGRRQPFFYREQIGDELNFDDGTQRVRLIPTEPGKPWLALRLASGPALSDQWFQWLTRGAGWRAATVLQETRDQILVRGGVDGGMQGPYSIARDFFRIDRRTWLPLEWEYRLRWSNSNAPEHVIETLQAQYDVPLPAAVTTLHLPGGMPVIDTLASPPAGELPTENVQRARGLTVQAQALAIDPQGDILVRVRSWLGGLKLGAAGTGSINDVETDHRYLTVNRLQPPPATVETGYHDEDGRAYVRFNLPRVGWSPANGDVLVLLAPLEPRPAGAALPRSLTLSLQVCPQIFAREGTTWTTSALFSQAFTWTVPLPGQAAPIRIDDFRPAGPVRHNFYKPGADDSTVAGNIAAARASAYAMARRYPQALEWERRAVAAVPPFTNTAQFQRLDLANLYTWASNQAQTVATYRTVIRISRQHPETWSYYADQARGGLKYLAQHPPR